MKILHVISSLNPAHGGPVEAVKKLSIALTALSAVVDVVCCDTSGESWLHETPCMNVIAVGPAFFRYGYAPRLVEFLQLHVHEYDIVIVNGLWQYCGLAVWRVMKRLDVPYIVFTHGMLDPWFKKTYPLKHLKKWLYWPWAEYRVLRDARYVVFTCEDERLLARESFWLYKVREAVTSFGTSSPPIESERLTEEFFSTYPAIRGKRLALFLSRIQAKKGCDILIEAFASVALQDESLHLVIAGPDQEGWVLQLKELACRLGIAERITWTGMLLGDLKWGAYYASEVFCLSSHQENFGIVVAEALACGRPVLISNKVNIWREIETDKAGFVESDTVEGTLRNLERWLALNEKEYGAMANRAMATFQRRFHIDRAAMRLLEIIRSSSK